VKKLSFLLIVICGACLSACTMPAKILIYNASAQDFVLEYVDEYHKTITKVVRVNEKAESITLLESTFSVRRNSFILKYSPKGFPLEFVENTGFGPFHSRIVKTQLEKDGCIYLVPRDGQYPARDHGVQPAGFPLCPSSTVPEPAG
jgi:hypothetical protein